MILTVSNVGPLTQTGSVGFHSGTKLQDFPSGNVQCTSILSFTYHYQHKIKPDLLADAAPDIFLLHH